MSSSSSSHAPDLTVDLSSGTTNMINHARTLLLNRNGATRPPADFFGEEVVPKSYAAVQLPSQLMTIRRALFGGDPDDAGLNYMVWQYMRVLHSTEFVEYVLALGTRITYLHDRSLLDYPYGATVVNNPNALQFVGTPDLGGTSGRLMTSWTIERLAPAVFSIKNLYTGKQLTQNPGYAGGVTDFMPMTGHQDFKVRVFDAYAAASQWTVEYLAKPNIEMDITSRAAQLNNIGAEADAALFPNTEPYKTFRQLWEQHIHLPYKLSGALLSLIYQTEELRSG
ncbi:MAG TPA: hypothetical protein VLT59_04315 [Steroidobacteraceae bacterium]|nr:hypothetical protein [Steroidobacteraceae bacterium]